MAQKYPRDQGRVWISLTTVSNMAFVTAGKEKILYGQIMLESIVSYPIKKTVTIYASNI